MIYYTPYIAIVNKKMIKYCYIFFMNFGEKLREELDFKGWTVKELSAATGVSLNTLNHYLNGIKSIPAANVAVRIAKALGLTVEYLFGDEGTSAAQKIFSGRIRCIAEKFSQLDEFDKSCIEILMDKLADRHK